ncbi:hypothetical protein OE88DRAFT_1648214 [Heliocybe sulcata]|uniref:F-box domain-containing protein n=1 Tax=Heliocybe sulcata TaxID=5364 RepID=A0A5C3MQG9_9AGAM|nr:hypothetical protein OE88DRAFT_1648214 [Heliocybe sulcata]
MAFQVPRCRVVDEPSVLTQRRIPESHTELAIGPGGRDSPICGSAERPKRALVLQLHDRVPDKMMLRAAALRLVKAAQTATLNSANLTMNRSHNLAKQLDMHTDDRLLRQPQTMPALPAELYQEIFEHIKSRRDLCSLIRISRSHQLLAAPFLYHTVELSRLPEDAEQFCKAIIGTPYYGSLVVSLTIDKDNLYQPASAVPELVWFQLWCNVAHVLRKLPRLETLHLVRVPQEYTWILKKCPFLLKELHCDFKFDSDLLSFLNTQPRLSSIHWCVWDTLSPDLREDLPPSFPRTLLGKKALPVLEELVTNCTSFAEALVPGRPVRTLRVISDVIFSISSSTAPLHCLEIYFPPRVEVVRSLLRNVVLQAPKLRVLGTLNFQYSPLQESLPCLAELKELRILLVWDEPLQYYLLRLKATCPSLQAVYSLCQGHLDDRGQYLRFPMDPIGEPQRLRVIEVPLWDWKDV